MNIDGLIWLTFVAVLVVIALAGVQYRRDIRKARMDAYSNGYYDGHTDRIGDIQFQRNIDAHWQD